MTQSDAMPLWMKAVAWVQSLATAKELKAAIARDAMLKKYLASFNWVDGKYGIQLQSDVVFAENEAHARSLCNEAAVREYPVIEVSFDDLKLVPPYVADPEGALERWTIVEQPLTDHHKDLAAKGQLGPARVEFLGKVLSLV